jgi:hypothetical protein
MPQRPNSDQVKIRLFKKKGYLIIQYSVTHPDRHSEQCRDRHADNLKNRYSVDFTDPQRSDRLKIKCNFDFQADSHGSSKVWSLTKEDAIYLTGYFFELKKKIIKRGRSWELRLDKQYDWTEWHKDIDPPILADRSNPRPGLHRMTRKHDLKTKQPRLRKQSPVKREGRCSIL